MNIAFLKINAWGNPTLQDWAPVAHSGVLKGMAVQLGRPDANKKYPLELWLDLRKQGPEIQWSWFRNWGRPFIEAAEPQSFGEVSDLLALVGKSHEDFAADGVLLLVDLHAGKSPRNLSEDFRGVFAPFTEEASQIFNLSDSDSYPVGMLVIYPGFQATVRAEGSAEVYTLLYPSAERGVFLIPEEPDDAAQAMHQYYVWRGAPFGASH